MTNEEVNEYNLKRLAENGDKYYYKRYGECRYKECSSACCRFVLAEMYLDDKYHKTVFNYSKNPIAVFKPINKNEQLVCSFHCPEITIDGRCKLHNTKKQSSICDMFPVSYSDSVYQYVKRYCTYKFRKVLIPKSIIKKYKKEIPKIEN